MEKFVPKQNEKFYMVAFESGCMVFSSIWNESDWQINILNSCGCYRTKEEAVAKAKEMLGIYVIDGVEYKRSDKCSVYDINGTNYKQIIYNAQRVESCAKEVTMQEVCDKFGYEVKIRKN